MMVGPFAQMAYHHIMSILYLLQKIVLKLLQNGNKNNKFEVKLMKIHFDDTSYVEISHSPTNKVQIVLSARDNKNPHNNIINSAEISWEQFLQMISELSLNFK